MNPEHSGGMHILAIATIGDLTQRPHARVPVGATISAVVDAMKALGRGCALVEEDGTLVGIFTERDLLSRVDHTDPKWGEHLVQDVMTPMPTVIRPADSLAEALRLLTQGRRRHLPVVDDRGHVLGLVSI